VIFDPTQNRTEYAKENFMSAPSRRPEIRRRRTRAEKIAKLRKRLAAATASTDKDRLTAKLHRVGLVSPGIPLIKSE
jgi:crotonobetainyl-CoA:carnitine CoA-transferase CaiB-like acyl-CoA transferase